MKNILSLLILFVASVTLMAQKTLSGKVVDTDGQPVAGASITVEESGKSAILAYGISNSKGEFKITFTTEHKDVSVKVKAFSHKQSVQHLKNETQSVTLKIEPQATEIKEVKLKTKLITKKGDTISYDLSQFDSKSDRTLADVLKKVPGIEVSSTGAITYQGEALNKFYVNGKDLMEGGYGTIVNSLPKDAVQKMEVMENHQPIKALQDKIPSQSPAINIKLKNKITMTGRGEVGAGFSPLLWNVKLTPMFFGQNTQWVVNYKANNNGETVENEGMILAFGNRWEGMRSQVSERSWLSVDQASQASLPEKRHLMNNVHYSSVNFLINPFKDKEWELKINANYSNNSVERSSVREVVYEPSQYFPSGATASTTINNNFYTDNAKGEVVFTKNAKKGYFKNVTTWNGFWNDNQAQNRIVDSRTGEVSLDEGTNSPSTNVQNSLSALLPFKNTMVNVMSYLSYQKDNQRLTTNYENFTDFQSYFGQNFNQLNQRLTLETFLANHSASAIINYKRWTITPEVGLNLSTNSMQSQLSGDGSLLSTDYQNDMKWNEIKPYTQVGINYKGGGINMNLTLPVNFYGIDYKDMLRNSNREISKTVFEPSFFFNYEFASFWKIWAFANLNYGFGSFGSLYEGNLLTSPRSIGNNDSLLPENRTISLYPRLEYRNPLNNLFFNIRYSYTNNNRNLITRNTLFSSGTSISEVAYLDNTIESQSESAEIGKFFPAFKTNISASFSNRDYNSFSQLVNQATSTSDLIETKNNTQAVGFKFNNTFFSWLSVDYSISFSWNKYRNLYYNTNSRTSGWSHNFAGYIYPLENHSLGFFWDDVSTSQADQTYRNSFFDLSYQYTWAKKNIDFEVKWLNIANKKVYETISYNATLLSTTRSHINIRPSQFMFTVKFNFK